MHSRFEVSSVFPKAGALVCAFPSLHKAKWKPRLKTRQMSAAQKAGSLSNKEMVVSLRRAGWTASEPGLTSAFVLEIQKMSKSPFFFKTWWSIIWSIGRQRRVQLGQIHLVGLWYFTLLWCFVIFRFLLIWLCKEAQFTTDKQRN